MPDPMKMQAIAEDGPLSNDPNLTVDDHDSQGGWPSPVVWKAGPNVRHVYVLSHITLTPTGVPSYVFERTLGSDEPDPPEGRVKPPN